jgi:putative ABC transport system substrate-binding protein
VFTFVSDPVAQGFVSNLAKPGGNITGFTSYEFAIGGKWLDLLKQIAPGLARVAVMFNPDASPQSKFFVSSVESAAASFGVQAIAAPVREAADIEPAIAGFARQPNGGLIFPTDSFTFLRRQLVVDLAARYRLPAIYAFREFVEAGGLMRYGDAQLTDQFRQASSYVDRILKGEKPGDLPIQQPTKYALSINLKAARALGIELPMGLMLRADEVIE